MQNKLTLYNTISRSKEIFIPLNKNNIRMYVCGPTVYDHLHLGNARALVVYDILFRIMRFLYGNENITYVRNITDIDDKIIIKAKELNININELTKNIILDFQEINSYLNCLSPSFEPKATEHIQDMISIIENLINNKFAYITIDGSVYFSVSKYHDYNKLSHRTFDKMLEGVRIELDSNKQDDKDFVLWKAAETDDNTINYMSPWGLGRPGWHIECSAMSNKYLGQDFDLHGGGADLIFPHHTNEIAQSKCAFPNSIFAKFWVHNGFLTVNGEKMSKSLGNFITVKDFINKSTKGEIVRLLLLSGNYRHPLDYNEKLFSDSQKMLDYWYGALNLANKTTIDSASTELDQNFLNAVLDDMNTPLAIKIINDYAKQIHNSKDQIAINILAKSLLVNANFLGLLQSSPTAWFITTYDKEIEELIISRNLAKKQKDFAKADSLREQLRSKGFIIEDKIDGSVVVRKI